MLWSTGSRSGKVTLLGANLKAKNRRESEKYFRSTLNSVAAHIGAAIRSTYQLAARVAEYLLAAARQHDH